MKTDKFLKQIVKAIKSFTPKMEFVCTIHPNDKHIKYPLKKNQPGLYALYEKGKKLRPVYIGETIDCILKRVYKHKRSLLNPDFKDEVTGKKFNKHNINRIQEFDLYFIPYEDLINSYDSRTIEGIFKLILNPIVFE